MSYAVRKAELPRSAGGSDRPMTALIHDYICLYSHDLRRKQKRWQDGKLKYHTHNKRVMVYDDHGGFVGDLHLETGLDLAEGDDLTLDRGGAIVQVCELVGTREQDLSELLDKRAKEVEQRRASAAARPPTGSAVRPVATPRLQLKHQPLNAVVPNAGSPIGRAAVPEHSPYEARRQQQEQESAAKRRKLSVSPPSKSGWASALFGTRISLTGGAGMMPRVRALQDTTNVQAIPGERERGKRDAEDDEVVVVEARSNGRARNEVASSRTESAMPRRPGNVNTTKRQVEKDAEEEVQARATKRATARTTKRATKDLPEEAESGEPRRAKTTSITKTRATTESPPPDLGATITSSEMQEPSRATPQDTNTGAMFMDQALVPSTPDEVEEVIRSSSEDEAPPPKKTVPVAAPVVPKAKKNASQRLERLPQPKHPVIEEDNEEEHPKPVKPLPSRLSAQRKEKQPAKKASTRAKKLPKPVSPTLEEDSAKEDIRTVEDASITNEPEQRTKLRIKSRPKRGLLVMNEKKNPLPDKSRQLATVVETPPAPAQASRPPTPIGPPVQSGFVVQEDTDEEDIWITHRNNRRKKGQIEARPDDTNVTDDDSYAQPARRVRKRKAHEEEFPFCSDHGDGESEKGGDDVASSTEEEPAPKATKKQHPKQKTAATGPRIVPIRKGVKCKEILGLVSLVDEELGPAPLALTTDRMSMLLPSNSATESTAAPEPTIAEEQQTEHTAPTTAAPPRIANPATRGKKAATKEHAAGQVPQVMVPMEPAATRRSIAVSAPALTKKASGTAVDLPGFGRANGGAWSRHAEDLLGMTRPEKRR
ncbi:hypothetical protein S7711_01858 [Stachybotrys chartarum IBT 7711]|uniref:5'-3' DNA helicase ZGRF1-like N-terminal domain-containing protein n=1 Tax=Stachybotrys chartarum (strain CBS 109288 / IBT 7711) TaxID=1280523 RepID=A0A084AJ68_STACB|nr:hypothetical protein S7711_01858 [Stachybotrys chartarum IBT 7711]